MVRPRVWACCLALGLFANAAAAQVLWKQPPRLSVSDWVSGPGGAEAAPRPPFKFVKENLDGTNPKLDVVDATGRTWVVKFGGEVHSDTFAARLLYAVGFAAVPTFFVEGGVIENVSGLKRAKAFVKKDGSFRNARFKLHERHKRQWSWDDNPFEGTRELGGLKIMVMLLSDWDTKDARDGNGSNNGILEESHSHDSSGWYAVTDWGASFGKSGGFFHRDRWDWRGYSAQTPRFATLESSGAIRWGFHGKHGEDIVEGVGAEDIRWLLPYLLRITDGELTAGLEASGAAPPVARQFTRAIRGRVEELQRIAQSADVKEASSK